MIDGTLVIGEVKERDDAFKMYDDAMERGDGAFLLDEERPDVFQASIGNLPPGKEVTVKLTYVTELAAAGRALRFVIPTTVSPRYAPAADRTGVGRPDAEALNPPRAFRVPYGLELTLRLAMSGTVTRLESPSHPIAVVMSGSTATVTLSSRDAALDRDFVLSVEADGLDVPAAWIEQDDDASGAIARRVRSRLRHDVGACRRDVSRRSIRLDGRLVDRRSAQRAPVVPALADARLPIQHRRLRVDIGSRCFRRAARYDDASLAEASAHVAGLQADLGGTELLPALSFVLQRPAARALPRQVVVLTDGEVTNTDAVLELAQAHASDARIFVFGIGAGASHHLVKGLARAGGGTAEFIFPGERIEPKVIRQLGRLLTPALTNVAVDWRGVNVKPATTAAPPVFAGHRLVVYGFGTASVPATIRLTAESPSGPLAFDVSLDPARAVRGRTVAALAARARIRELEESPAWLTSRGSRQTDRKASAVRQEIVQLATKYGLLSRETSYVAIERRETPVTGEVQLRRVPIALTSGWADSAVHDSSSQSGASLGMPMARRLAAMSAADGDDDEQSAFLAMSSQDTASIAPASLSVEWRPAVSLALGRPDGSRDASRASGRPPARRPRMASPPPPPTAPMYRLIALQRADGSWDLTDELAAAMGRPLPDLEDQLEGGTGPRPTCAAPGRRPWHWDGCACMLPTANRSGDCSRRRPSSTWRGLRRPAPGGVAWSEMAASFLARN